MQFDIYKIKEYNIVTRCGYKCVILKFKDKKFLIEIDYNNDIKQYVWYDYNNNGKYFNFDTISVYDLFLVEK